MSTSHAGRLGQLSRRSWLTAVAGLGFVWNAPAQQEQQDPWTSDKLMQPADLARLLNGNGPKPTVISVAFPVLYRQRHIAHALPAGPASKPEGLAALRQAVAALPKDREIVIYCGCCPMEHCPNIRPAYKALEAAGFRNVRVLELRSNLRTDWTAKGYPVEPSA
jgi:thiosulfate/3-mercaptopyruvate sulfurtransferase